MNAEIGIFHGSLKEIIKSLKTNGVSYRISKVNHDNRKLVLQIMIVTRKKDI